jgi:hypothetical protein
VRVEQEMRAGWVDDIRQDRSDVEDSQHECSS